MSIISSCFGRGRSREDERTPLLPQYNDDTRLQRRVHQKLHSYQMVRAMTKGFMPSNEQLITNLRTLLASDVLNPDPYSISDSGRQLSKFSRQWLEHFIEMLQNKNGSDQIQDFVWFLTKSRISVDVEDIARRTSKIKARADTAAAYRSLQTVGSLLLTNSDFRVFLADLQNVGKEIFRDSAFLVSDAAKDVGEHVDPGHEVSESTEAADGAAPSHEEIQKDVQEVANIVGEQAQKVGKGTAESAKQHLDLKGGEGQTMIRRLQKAVVKLRKRNDYSDSVSTIALLIKRYAMVYSRAAEQVLGAVKDDVESNEELDYAMRNCWSLVTSFGSKEEWGKLEEKFKEVANHREKDPQFEDLMDEVGNTVQGLLTDPDVLTNLNEKVSDLREKYNATGNEGSLRHDVNALIGQLSTTLQAVFNDQDITNLWKDSMRILSTLSPANRSTNPELIQDSINVFAPLLVQAIQYIPIPRLEISVPEIDLLLENVIIEPGVTVNSSSFFPFRLRVETYNDLEIRKARMRTVSKITSLVTIKLDGISVRADEIGYWMRAHSGLLRLADEGIASVQLDERGMDVHLDVEICEEKLEKILTLKAVRVHVHKLKYELRRSKFSWVAWLMKPLLQPVIRKVMEKQVASAIGDFFHTANRELLYARERLRATRISDPQDLRKFIQAVTARLQGDEDPDTYTRVGVAQPGKGVFKGVYAPGSVVKLWNEEAMQASETIDDFDRGGWRNEIFDVPTTSAV